MRDPLCDESYLLKKIEINKNKYIRKLKDKIVELEVDIEKGIQRYPRDNQA